MYDWWRIFYLYVDSCHWRSICKLLTFQATIIFIKSSNLGFKWTTNDFCLYNWWWATQQSMWEQWWFRRTRFWGFKVTLIKTVPTIVIVTKCLSMFLECKSRPLHLPVRWEFHQLPLMMGNGNVTLQNLVKQLLGKLF